MSSVATIAVGASVAGAAVSSMMAPSPGGSGGNASAAADPFASQRGQYQTMLSAMMTGKNADGTPYTFSSSDPSYQFRFQQGQDAVNASQASMGNLNSGNRALALENYGQQAASAEYANQFSRLSQLAGANVGSPAAAGQIIAGQQAQQQQGASAIGSAVGQAVTGWGNSAVAGMGSGSGGGFNSGTFDGGSNSYGFSGPSAPDYSGVSGGMFGG